MGLRLEGTTVDASRTDLSLDVHLATRDVTRVPDLDTVEAKLDSEDRGLAGHVNTEVMRIINYI